MTYSIVALDKKTGSLAVAVASGSTAVGTRVPWVEENVGAIATQAYTNIIYGKEGLKLLKMGYTPEKALDELLKMDPEKEKRQVAIIDNQNRKTVFTGKECPDWKGEYIGEYYIIIGNLIVGSKVIDSARAILEKTEIVFPLRLAIALYEGEKAGGDRRGNRSAALVVRGRYNINIRIDDEENPAEKLLTVFKRDYPEYA